MLGVPKNGTTTHVVVPSQHKHKIKHDKTTMQSYLSMPERHKYRLLIFTYSQTASGRLASIKQIACTICLNFYVI